MSRHPIGLDSGLSGATAEQRRVYETIARGPRAGVPAPFLAMLDAPALTMAIQAVGVTIRYENSLPDAQRELAILATAGALGCRYEWNYHAPIARAAGLTEDVINATAEKLAKDIDHPLSVIITFCQEIALNHKAPEDILVTILALLGRQGTTELIAIVGYYSLLANFIFIGKYNQDQS